MAVSVEIIDFTRPVANCKNLYISGILTDENNEDEIMTALYEACQPFGLLHEVQVFPGSKFNATSGNTSRPSEESYSYFAFVKFYSFQAAQKAKSVLSASLKIGLKPCKVAFASRNKETESGQQLYLTRCQELANYYLGFNGWTSAITRMEQDIIPENSDAAGMQKVRFLCIVKLSFPRQGLTTQGLGAWEEVFSPLDCQSKQSAFHRARKRSYQRAVEDGFSRVLLVVVGGRKVTVEVDTTRPDDLDRLKALNSAEQQVLQVTELGEDPEAETEMLETSSDLDDINLHILQELEDGISRSHGSP